MRDTIILVIRTARMLIIATLVYNVAEGLVAVIAGLQAGSISLVAFGIDSYLEVAAASVVLWRLGAPDSDDAERAERRAVRFIGWTFLALAASIVYQAGHAFVNSEGADESVVGIALALASVTVMPAVALWKLRIAARGNILALAAEAKETLACSYLSITLLAGLVCNALLGWWWIDAVTVLLLTPWLIKEGIEGIQGEEEDERRPLCSCRSCLFGLRTCPLPCCTRV